jgi:uncharacterized protein YyaL (SSP411 family)
MANLNEIMVATNTNAIATLTDKKLIQATNRIEKYMVGAKKSLFAIAIEMRKIDSQKLWDKDGFKNVSDYGEKVLGYKHAMTNNLIRVATSYIEATTQESVLTHEDRKDWSLGQLQELLTITPEEAQQLVDDNLISVDMSTKKIREAVKTYKNPVIEGEVTEDTTEDTTEEVTEEVDAITELEYNNAMMLLGEVYDELAERNESELVDKIKAIMASVDIIAGK